MNPSTSRRALGVALATVVAAASLAACSGSSGGIKVTGAWARNSSAIAGAGAAYLVIQNTGSAADALVSVSTPAAKTAEMHETKVIDSAAPSMGAPAASTGMGGMGSAAPSMMPSASGGMGGSPMMGMVPVSRIEVPAGGSAELKPGGYHLMLIDLVADLKVGDTIELTLTFEKAGKITVKAEVRAN
jgi:copper(I)-binding protein